MKAVIRRFIKSRRGQDLIEYSLLIAFVALASAALFLTAGQSVSGVWTGANSALAHANPGASSASRPIGHDE